MPLTSTCIATIEKIFSMKYLSDLGPTNLLFSSEPNFPAVKSESRIQVDLLLSKCLFGAVILC